MMRVKIISLALLVVLMISACSQSSGQPLQLPRVIIPQVDRQARDFGKFSGISIDFDGDINFDKLSLSDSSGGGNIIPLFNIELLNDRLVFRFQDGRFVAQIGDIQQAINFDEIMFVIKFAGGQQGTAPGNEKTLFVGANQVPCTGVALQECLLVRENPEDAWRYFYDQIQGFDYDEGYLYELRVVEAPVANAPADAPSLRLELADVVSKSPVDVSLTDMTWNLESLAGDPPLTDSGITAIFNLDGQLYGSSGCNSYSTGYQVGGEDITIEPVATTRMACPQVAVMDQEAAYLAALESARTYDITGYRLTMFDEAGKAVLTFLGEDF